MSNANQGERNHPAAWVPTLYFAEGIPFFAISLIAGIAYKRLGLANDTIAFYTSWLLLPWSLKPIWSPLLEMFKTKKFFVVLFQFTGGLCLAGIALCLPSPNFFRYTLALFAVVAFCSATHDIAADGLYIASLSKKQQAAYAGWQGGFFNVARFFSQGGLVILAGYLEARTDIRHAWMTIFAAMGLILVVLSMYHSQMLPSGGVGRRAQDIREMAATFWMWWWFLQEAQYSASTVVHFSVSRRRRAGGQTARFFWWISVRSAVSGLPRINSARSTARLEPSHSSLAASSAAISLRGLD